MVEKSEPKGTIENPEGINKHIYNLDKRTDRFREDELNGKHFEDDERKEKPIDRD